MSIIQNIREKYAAVSIAVIAISLVGFILMDALSSRTGVFDNSLNPSIGEINGIKVDQKEFDQKLSLAEENYRQRGMNVNDEMRQQLNESLWNNEIDKILLSEEYKKLGIVFTDVDIDEALFGENPPADIKEQFKDPKTGIYNAADARQQLRKILTDKKSQEFKANLTQYIKEAVISPGIRNKYQDLIKGSVYYPKWLYEKEQNDQVAFSSINFIAIPYSSISDSTIKVTENEIQNYIKNHSSEYKQDRTTSISYVVFDAGPTALDSSYIKNKLLDKVELFKSTTKEESFIKSNKSNSPFFDGYVLHSKLNVPNADSIRSLSVGSIFGPYTDGPNFVLAKMVDKKQLPDSVKCRHILISSKGPRNPNAVEDSVAKKRADSIATAIATGANFAALALQYSDDPESKEKGGEYDFNSQGFGSLAKPFAEFIFYKPTGSKSVIKTEFGYHYIEVMQQKNFEIGYKVAYLSLKVDPSKETINQANATATQFATNARDEKSFEKWSKDKKLSIRTADLKTNDYSIAGLGNARKFIRWAFEQKAGVVSDPYEIGNNIIVALISAKQEKGLMSVKTAKPLVEPLLINQKKADQIIKNAGNPSSLNALAAQQKQNIEKADSLTFSSPFLSSYGSEPKVIGASFYAAYKNKLSPAIIGNSGVYFIETTINGLKPSLGMDYSQQRLQMEQMQKGSLIYRSFESLKKSIEIEDNRIKVY
jgi:peptidyl-prolyl cis-trans isomerase D